MFEILENLPYLVLLHILSLAKMDGVKRTDQEVSGYSNPICGAVLSSLLSDCFKCYIPLHD